MRPTGVKRLATNWRKRADEVSRLVPEMPPGIRLEARGYAEALRECANQLELSITRALQRSDSGR